LLLTAFRCVKGADHQRKGDEYSELGPDDLNGDSGNGETTDGMETDARDSGATTLSPKVAVDGCPGRGLVACNPCCFPRCVAHART